MDKADEPLVPGNFWYSDMVQGTLPPLVPAMPPGDSDWDTSMYRNADYDWKMGELERRHSGWDFVEKKWSRGEREAAHQSERRPPSKEFTEAMSQLHPTLSLPPPRLEADFRMKVTLSPQSAKVAVGDGFKVWTTFTGGVWSGGLGNGTVVSGGQDTTDMILGGTQATQVEATYRLRTNDEPPAFIECRTRGFRTGSPGVMQALEDPKTAQHIDPRQYRHRVFINMKTTDERYSEKVNGGMWIGTCLWQGLDIIFDGYKVL